METNNNFYVYLHIRKDNGLPFYVGKGSTKWDRVKSKKNRNNWWMNIVNNYDYDYIFLEENISEKYANTLEKIWIKRIGRKDLGLGTLVNLTDGGEGKTGCFHTEETRKKISENTKQRMTDEICKKISLREKGKKIPLQTRKKISNSLIGRKREKHTEETKKKMRRHKTGGLCVNLETGIFYFSGREAAYHHNYNCSTLKNMLSGRRKNKTSIVNV
jgi:hypothetical protein